MVGGYLGMTRMYIQPLLSLKDVRHFQALDLTWL